MYAYLEIDYTKIYIISENPVLETQLDIYKDNVLIGSFISSSFSGTNPDPLFTKVLDFPKTSTSIGDKYIFTFLPVDIEQVDSNYFEDGVYHFILSNNGSGALPLVGVVVDRGLLCCMSTLLNSTDTNCSLSDYESVNVANALISGSKAALCMGDVDSAVCQFEQAKCYANCTKC